MKKYISRTVKRAMSRCVKYNGSEMSMSRVKHKISERKKPNLKTEITHTYTFVCDSRSIHSDIKTDSAELFLPNENCFYTVKCVCTAETTWTHVRRPLKLFLVFHPEINRDRLHLCRHNSKTCAHKSTRDILYDNNLTGPTPDKTGIRIFETTNGRKLKNKKKKCRN